MKCFVTECESTAQGLLWQGKPYCNQHYNELMSNAFEEEWSQWDDDTQPSPWLLSLFGRFLEEKWTVNGLLSKARVRDRGFNFIKNDTGFAFEITRHPGAFTNSNPYSVNRIVQMWNVSMQEGRVDLLNERPWTTSDPE